MENSGVSARFCFLDTEDEDVVKHLASIADHKRFGARSIQPIIEQTLLLTVAHFLETPPSEGLWRLQLNADQRFTLVRFDK